LRGLLKSAVVEVVVLVVLAFALAMTTKTYVVEAYEIKGRSMVPTFENGERVVVLKVFYDVERGDVVIFSSTEDPTKDLIKRVIGLPGEHVRIEGGKVYIDGELLEEDYLNESRVKHQVTEEDQTLAEGEYYVLGDNRDDSHDSRRFGAVSETKLKGKVVIRWWPFHHLRTF
jgi:signal peptidase I